MGQVPRTIHRFCSSRLLHDSHAKTNPIYEMRSSDVTALFALAVFFRKNGSTMRKCSVCRYLLLFHRENTEEPVYWN